MTYKSAPSERQVVQKLNIVIGLTWPSDVSFQVTNFPKFLRDIRLKGKSDLTKMEERIVTEIPETLEEFFDKYPEVLYQCMCGDSHSLCTFRSVRATWTSPPRPTHLSRGTECSSSPRGGRPPATSGRTPRSVGRGRGRDSIEYL